MQRLIEAATSRDILLKELATIIYENFASERVVIFESLNNKPIAPSVFLGCRQIEVDKLKEEFANAISMGRNHLGQATINLLEDRTNNRVWLYFEPKTTSSIDTSRMKPLLKQSELALENCSLRALTRSAVQVTDKSRIQTLIPGFIYASAAMCDVVERIQKIRTSDTNVLITGESGTGKDVIARAVHAESARRDAIFLPFNCTATPKELIESQLFGHRKGAFTGATSNYQGIIRAAEGGTLFLDEIGDLSLEIQPKLLRFLEAGEIQPLGEPKPLKVDVRVLAATNADLERAVQEGRFREDLHYRLNIIRIHVPPLRERREEIPLLTSYYLQHFANRSAKKNVTISQEALECLTNYNWPGNIRQLKTEIERVMAYSTDDTVIVPDDLSPEIARTDGFEYRKITTPSAFPSIPVTQNSSKPKISKNSSAAAKNLKEATELLEKQMIEEALERNDFNISRTARDLGLSRRGLRLKMFQYDLVDQ